MLRIGNLRIGKGIALIIWSKQLVLGSGSKSFVLELADEVGGVDLTRSLLPSTIREYV